MKKTTSLLFCALLLSLSACAFVPKLGMGERRWRSNALSSDLVYIEGDVKAYRSSGSYYYFRKGKLVAVATRLMPATEVPEAPAKK